jgi:hypothetical protein
MPWIINTALLGVALRYTTTAHAMLTAAVNSAIVQLLSTMLAAQEVVMQLAVYADDMQLRL